MRLLEIAVLAIRNQILLSDPPRDPLICDFCGRFVSTKEAKLINEYGDYGSILSTSIMCPACAKKDSNVEDQ